MEELDFKLIGLIIGVLVMVIIVIMALPFAIVGAGERGVVTEFGRVTDSVLGEGLHFRVPFVQSVHTISVRVQKNDVKAEAASKDLQDVNMDVVVNYHIDPVRVNKVFQQIGDNSDVFERIISPNTNEVIKASTAQFTAEEIVRKRQELKDKIDKGLIDRLVTYGVVLDDVSLTNVDFSKEFNEAIEAKQVAEQESLKAKFIADKAIREAEARVNKAKGEAEAQRLQQQTLTTELLQKMAIEKWDGRFPQYFGGQSLPFLTLPIR